MPMSKRALAICCSLVVGLVLAGGCGKRVTNYPNRGPVKGVVTLDGKPIGSGNITLVSVKDNARRVTIPLTPKGTFIVINAPLGDVLVTVETESVRRISPNDYVPIPKKYANAKTSGLTAVIAHGTTEEPTPLVIELKSK
jgi:hypothetical protein